MAITIRKNGLQKLEIYYFFPLGRNKEIESSETDVWNETIVVAVGN